MEKMRYRLKKKSLMKERGRIYSYIDNFVMNVLIISSFVLYLVSIEKDNETSDFAAYLIGSVGIIQILFIIGKVIFSKVNKIVSEDLKHIIDSVYLFSIFIGLSVVILNYDYLKVEIIRYIGEKWVGFSLIFFFSLYGIAIIFGLIRWGLAFDYYQSFYLKNNEDFRNEAINSFFYGIDLFNLYGRIALLIFILLFFIYSFFIQ